MKKCPWLDLSYTDPKEEPTTPRLPSWLKTDEDGNVLESTTHLFYEEPTQDDMQELKEGKPRLPDWLEKDENGEIIAEAYYQPKSSWSNDYNYLTEQDKEFLQDRGIYDFLIGRDNQTIQLIIKQIRYMERVTNITISRERLTESSIPIIREKAEIQELQDLSQTIREKNNLIQPDLYIPLKFQFPTKQDFKFNPYAESQHYQLTRVTFDVENSKQTQKPICVGAYNYATNRLVIAINDKKRAGEFYAINDNIYLIFTPNLWEGIFFADIELIIATIFQSALMEGQNDLNTILNKLELPKKLQINQRILEEYLNAFPLRRSVWIAHHAQFDIDMLNWTHKQAKYKFTFFEKTLPHETVPYYLGRPISKEKIKNNKEIKNKAYNVNHYTLHLGNHDAGFKFRIQADIRNRKSMFRANLSPIQKDAFTNLWIIDTITLSFAMRNPKHGLLDLSQDTKFPKLNYKEFNFPIEDLDIYNQQKITKPIKYLMFDLFSTLAIYEKFTNGLNYAELKELLQKNTPDFKFGINWRPRTSKILSTATISKETIFSYLKALNGLSQSQIENNIAHERLHQQNFELTYSGGVTEALTWGILESNFETNELIFYDDFQGLYDSIARLIHADLMYQLASERKLYPLLNTNLNKGKTAFWQTAKKLIKIIRQRLKGRQVLLPDNIFQELIGTVEINTQHPLQIRTNAIEYKKSGEEKKGARCWKIIQGHKPLHLIDLLNAVIRAAIEFNQDINVLEAQIKFLKIERYNFSKHPIPKWGDEFFTRLVQLRIEKILQNNPIEQMIKYVGKSSYGISGEGINKEDITGKLFIPAIFGSFTAGARFLITLPEIMIKKLGGTVGYTDTDSIIYRILASKRKIITEFFSSISKLKNETDYGEILKTFIAKKKKYSVLSRNINEKKFPDQFIKLPNGDYVVGKIHGKAQYDKRNFSNTIFHIYKDLFDSFSTKNTNIKQIVQKHKNKHPIFRNISYASKDAPIMKGILKFYYKTRSINYKYKNEFNKPETKKIRVKEPIFLLDQTQFDSFDLFIFYDLLENKILITNLSEMLIRSNFFLYANLSKNRVKILWTIPLGEETQLDWENRFLKFIIKLFQEKHDDFYMKIQGKQAQFILNFAKTSKQFLKEQFKEAEIHLQKENFKDLFNNYISKLTIPITKNKWFFNRTYHIQKKSFSPKTRNWHEFAENFGAWLTTEFQGSAIIKEFKNFSIHEKKLFNQLMNQLGIDPIKPPTVKELKEIAKSYKIPNYSKMKKEELEFYTYKLWEKENKPEKRLEHLFDRIADYKDYSPDGRIHWILDEILNINTVEYDEFLTYSNFDLKPINPYDRNNILGYQHWNEFFHQIQSSFINEAINRNNITEKLINYFSFDKSKFHRYIKEKHELYYELAVEKQKAPEKSNEMFTHNVLLHKYFTDGVDYRLYCHLPLLDFAEELLANSNALHSQNLINLGRIASYIYYKTHNREEEIPKIYSKDPRELPCPKTNSNIHVPFRKRLLIDPYQETHNKNDIKIAFDNLEIQNLVFKGILKETKNEFQILDPKRLEKWINTHIIKKSYKIFGLPKPTNQESQFPFYCEKKYLGKNWSYEIVSNRGKHSLAYNSKLLINFLVGNKRILMCDLHINPNSQNLLNIELFQTTIKEVEENDWIVRELLLDLFQVRELAFFTRNASITIKDMKEKSDLSYLRKTFYLATSHMILEDAIRNNSQTKIGFLSLTGQTTLQYTTPTIFFAYHNSAIIDKFNEWIKKLPKKKAMKALTKEITVMPHKSSKGITINHWGAGIAISLYTKDQHWYRSKLSRVARYRNIEMTETLSEEIMSRVWEENTIRYEITLFGFEAIHTYEYHAILNDLEQFILQIDELFNQHPEANDIFQEHLKRIQSILPLPLFSNKYQTPPETISKATNKWLETEINNSGYSTRKNPPTKLTTTSNTDYT